MFLYLLLLVLPFGKETAMKILRVASMLIGIPVLAALLMLFGLVVWYGPH
jgi:hypothetical protein